MSDSDEPLWLADPSVDWRIVLAARLRQAPDAVDVERRLVELHDRQGWPGAPRFTAGPDTGPDTGPGTGDRTADDDALVRAVAGGAGAAPVAAGTGGPGGSELVLAAEHQYLDGLGLLAVLTELTGVEARSAARGLAPRTSQQSFASAVARRLTEVALKPPARVARTRGTGADPSTPSTAEARGSTYADLRLDRRAGVTDLVHATARAVGDFNRARGGSSRRVAIAVGASTVGGAAPRLADDSALLRLRDAETCDHAAIRAFLASAPTQPSPGQSLEGSASWVTRAAGVGFRVLGPRLGSTVTVSHLGDVTADVSDLRFYPVAGGASAVSLGAVTLHGRTLITARGRRDEHSRDGLGAFLGLVAQRLGPA